eukprot:TRINITY_DN12009_c0_g1_i2.p1 TRINITY_DN12009_c0_g1~~TRINITY_DN12009_c0_g1_i2.p1  ORF type:complete len:256 (-),score=59.18 TRINITY_DN12009_c0_g1_i2:299-1066(-)
MDMKALRDYVTAESSQNMHPNTVLLDITHSLLKARYPEQRFDLFMTVADVKDRLHSKTGTSPDFQDVYLVDNNGRTVAHLNESHRPLGYYSPISGYTLHVVDLNPHSLALNGGLDDTSRVEKFKLSDEEYSKRENTYRKFKEEQLKKNPNWTPFPKPEKAEVTDETGKEEAEGIKVTDRCEVQPGGKRGTVMFVGPIPELPAGFWVGVKLDEPLGKNDGCAKGRRVFECPPNYGVFVRPDKVEVGDFPEEDFEEL